MLAAVEALRASGERVVFALPSAARSGDESDGRFEGPSNGVSRKLCLAADGDWVVVDIQME